MINILFKFFLFLFKFFDFVVFIIFSNFFLTIFFIFFKKKKMQIIIEQTFKIYFINMYSIARIYNFVLNKKLISSNFVFTIFLYLYMYWPFYMYFTLLFFLFRFSLNNNIYFFNPITYLIDNFFYLNFYHTVTIFDNFDCQSYCLLFSYRDIVLNLTFF